jgi:PAS domain S-box-containing protein
MSTIERLLRLACRLQKELYRVIVDSLPACICMLDAHGQLIYANKVAIFHIARPLEEILGLKWMEHIHPDQRTSACEEWTACVNAVKPLDVTWAIRQYDGVYRWQHILAEPLLVENGTVLNWYMLGHRH